ncbi:MAG: phosphoribosylformylglycinamidine synthase [Bacilli bacterium]|nr:phosphoribosylformylglycinamidine synthase [Bacilli bacterium]
MVNRIYVEKKPGLQNEANSLFNEFKNLVGIKGLKSLRILNRYDLENIDPAILDRAIRTVLSEPQLDDVYTELPKANGLTFAVEYLPGQFDQRADSAAQCIQIMAVIDKPIIKTAKVYLLDGDFSEEEIASIKKYVINPVEAREASLEMPKTLKAIYDIPTSVATLDGFINKTREELDAFVKEKGLAMDLDDIAFCQAYFKSEHRDPTITEIRMIDTYWSDHCRHTTFLTTIDSASFEDAEIQAAYDEYIACRAELNRTKPINLMDMGTLAAKVLKKRGQLQKLDESEEINACTVKIDVTVDGKVEKWLLLFKNETHNHPTEIEPFGGAATCIGGAIRDPLSGRSYVYGAMRVTGAGDPTIPLNETLEGKLPQRKIVQAASNGYSSYGNQIGLATSVVDEIYHPGYVAKRMEIGAVIAATPEENVRRECPVDGDIVILLGGRTGRDGVGGATGSSKAHNAHSVETCGAEVQKGNAPEERKLQRLFRNYEACRMIKRCNDFGAGGVSVAIGELADGLTINLNAVPKKYDGLDGTELAISESQERMAVVVEKENVEKFMAIANSENLEATVVAVVTENPRLVMKWNDKVIVDISREFLNSNGAEKHIDVLASKPVEYKKVVEGSFGENLKALAGDLNICSKRGLSERFDSTIGAGAVTMPFGGKYQRTPTQTMVTKISVEEKHTDDCSFMAWGYNPFIMEKNPYQGAYLSVVESLCKLIASGATFEDTYLTFQEYFKKPMKDARRWGEPMSALLGAFKAQLDYGVAAIGGKDSMSGSFEKLDVPPTLVSFAVTTGNVNEVITNEFKKAGNKVYLLKPEYDANGLPNVESLKALFKTIENLNKEGKIASCYTPTLGGVAEAVIKACMGNGYGFKFNDELSLDDIYNYCYGAFMIESSCELDGLYIGEIANCTSYIYKGEEVSVEEIDDIYESKLEGVYPTLEKKENNLIENFSYEATSRVHASKSYDEVKVLIPVFPGTNCEFDSAKVMRDAGAKVKIFVINNLDTEHLNKSINDFAEEIKSSQIIFVPGGFSGGDEPDGSAKFITSFFRNEAIKKEVTALLEEREGLMLGICNGFQALVKLGLVPYGKIMDTDQSCPTLTFNNIARHQSKIVRTRIASNKSPWLANTKVGEVYNVAISHGEGKFLANEELVRELAKNGQVATQYVNLDGNATDDIRYNPNGSTYAIEGITSFDGRVLGKMGHSERIGNGLYKNVYGEYDMALFKSAVAYFKK